MEFMSEISQVVYVGRDLLVVPIDFFQLNGPVESYFRLRGLDFESSIPGSSFGGIKASTKRTGVSEGCINYMREAKARNQFNSAYARQPATLAKQAIICSALEFR